MQRSFLYNLFPAAALPLTLGLAFGSGGVLSMSPPAVSFPAVQNTGTSSTPVSVTVTNVGSAATAFTSVALHGGDAADFILSGNTCTGSIAAGSSCSVYVVFSPTAGGARMSSIQFADNASGNPQTVTVSGTAQSASQNLVLSPTTLVFAQTTMGSSANSFVQLFSFSDANITFTGLQVTGANPGDFAVVNSTCTPLYPGQTCEVVVQFTPQATGLRTATLQLQDTAAGSPQNVPLAGTGIALFQSLVFSPPNLDVGSQNVGSSVTYPITVASYGTGAATFTSYALSGKNMTDFALTANSCPTGSATLAPYGKCQINVTFTPSGPGLRNAWLTVTSSAPGSPQLLSLQGSGQTVNNLLAFSSGALAFGAQNIGTASGATVVSLQSSSNSVMLSNISLTGTNAADFAIATSTCFPGLLLGPYYQCSVQVNFTPTALGLRTADLTFTDNASGSPQNVTLEGIGQAAQQQIALSAINQDFGLATVGFDVYAPNPGIVLTNMGDTPVVITAASISGANGTDFTATGDCLGTLAPGAACNAAVVFAPSAAGVRSAQLTIQDTAPDSPQIVGLYGTGQALDVALTSTSCALLYPAQNIGSASADQVATITNASDAPVTLASVTPTGRNPSEFALTNECPTAPATLSQGSSCSVLLTFTPAAAGLRTSTLQFTDPAGDVLQSLTLAGIGSPANPPLSLTPSAHYFGSQISGTSTAVTSVKVSNPPGGASASLSVQLGGPNASDFSISSNTCGSNLPAGASCTVGLAMTPSGLGARIAALEVTANGATMLDCALVGTGVAGAKTVVTDQLAVDLGSAVLGQTNYSGNLQIQNSGSETLTISGISIGGANPSDFSMGGSSCGSTLVPGSSCNLSLQFTPLSPGLRTATVLIADDGTGSPQAIPLSGLGEASTQILDLPQSVTFPLTSIASTSTQTATVNNVGTSAVTVTSVTITGLNASEFTVGQPVCGLGAPPVAAGQYCSYPVSFTPGAAGFRSATLLLTDSATGSPQSIALDGFALPVTKTLVYPKSASFLLTPTGNTAPAQTTGFNNTGNAAINLGGVSITGTNAADFAISQNTCGSVIYPGTACTVSVTFTPSAGGVRTAILQLTDDATGSPHTVTLNAVGEPSTYAVNLPSAVDLGLSPIGVTMNSVTAIYLYNVGTVPVTFTNIAFSGTDPGDFSVYSTSCIDGGLILPGRSCSIYIGFTPAAAGARSANMLVTDNAAGSPQSVSLLGVGQSLTDTAEITPALSFGPLLVKSSQSLSAELYNSGTATVSVASVSVAGTNASEFVISSSSCPVGTQLAPGLSCLVNVTFTPAAPGTRTATLRVTDNALGGTQSCVLQGIGK